MTISEDFQEKQDLIIDGIAPIFTRMRSGTHKKVEHHASFQQQLQEGLVDFKEEIIIAGFGGQGVLSMGKILAYAALVEDKEVTWMPSYGPEQRGGTANVTVIVSDNKISSPILSMYDTAVILNHPSLEKFEQRIKPGGTLIYDGYGISTPPSRKDITVYRIDAMDAAAEMKAAKAFNMIVLGGLLKVRPLVEVEDVLHALRKTLPERHHHLIPMNEAALRKGMEIICATD